MKHSNIQKTIAVALHVPNLSGRKRKPEIETFMVFEPMLCMIPMQCYQSNWGLVILGVCNKPIKHD